LEWFSWLLHVHKHFSSAQGVVILLVNAIQVGLFSSNVHPRSKCRLPAPEIIVWRMQADWRAGGVTGGWVRAGKWLGSWWWGATVRSRNRYVLSAWPELTERVYIIPSCSSVVTCSWPCALAGKSNPDPKSMGKC